MTDRVAPTSPLTLEETFESLTGFDDLAIKAKWGKSPTVMAQDEPTVMIRSLIFIDQTRRGSNAHDAHQYAMNLTMKQAMGYFTADPEEVDADDPDTVVGKDVSALV